MVSVFRVYFPRFVPDTGAAVAVVLFFVVFSALRAVHGVPD
jgi:hypothetical protein